MSAKYSGLTVKEADDLMARTIGRIVCEELTAARKMSPEEWEDRDPFQWSQTVAGAILCAIQNRRIGAP